jgi:hypothetical protein
VGSPNTKPNSDEALDARLACRSCFHRLVQGTGAVRSGYRVGRQRHIMAQVSSPTVHNFGPAFLKRLSVETAVGLRDEIRNMARMKVLWS